MAAEFHRKTAALFEEFKKRELYYLNTEKKVNSSLSWENDFSTPTQDYFQKIKKKERETEQTYRELMKHLEDLDKRTDQMSLKLEKLHALRSIAIGSSNSTWPSVDETFDRPFQSYYTSTVPHSASPTVIPSFVSTNAFQPLSTVDYTLSKFNSQCESTQTENIFCERCHYPLATNAHLGISNVLKPATYSNENMTQSNQIHQINEVHKLSSETAMPFKSSTPSNNINEPNADDQNINEKLEYDNIHYQQHVKVSEGIPSKADDFSHRPSITGTLLKLSDGAEDNLETEVKVMKSDNNITDTNEKVCEDLEVNSLGSTTDTIEKAISKSDDESMNREFDFLESDKRSIIKRVDIQPIDPNPPTQDNLRTGNLNLESSHDTTSFRGNTANSTKRVSVSTELNNLKQQTEHGTEKAFQPDVGSMEKIKISDELKLDSSFSAGPPSPSPFHSENASLASESDSFSEKETPLTASAAYQALLGNVSAGKTAPKRQPIIDSDSEDEIENALASAVRKSSSVTFETSAQSQKTEERKESIAEAKTKTETKTSIAANKPQNKLSKNTRKVLGLDTSSGSEVELAVKTNQNLSKSAEDSDEFDFYD